MRRERTSVTRLLSLVLALLMTMATLSGCGKKAEETVPATTAPVETVPPEPVAYTPDLEVDTEAVADIVSIEPMYQLTGATTSWLCKCVTAQQETIWVAVPLEAYHGAFGALANGMDLTGSPITLTQSLRMEGIVVDMEELYAGLSDIVYPPVVEETIPEETIEMTDEDVALSGEVVTNETTMDVVEETVAETTAATVPETVPETTAATVPETVPETTAATVPETTPETEPAAVVRTALYVEAFDQAAVDAATGKTLEEAPYSADAPSLAPVTAEICKLYPAYIIETSTPGMEEVVCEAQDVNGGIVWLYMPKSLCTAHFGYTDLDLLVPERTAVALEEALLVKGIVRYAEELNPGLETSTGIAKMILVSTCEVAVPEETIPAETVVPAETAAAVTAEVTDEATVPEAETVAEAVPASDPAATEAAVG